MRPVPLRASAFAIVAAAAVLAACGTTVIDRGKAEGLVRSAVVEDVGARVASVRCPEAVPVRKGDRFTCDVQGSDGSQGKVAVRQVDGDGSVEVTAPFLHVRDAEKVMSRELARQLKRARVTLRCPEIVVARKGERFTCRATTGTTKREVAVRLTDDEGRFSYRVS